MSIPKTQSIIETKLARIAWLSAKDPNKEFSILMHLYSEESLAECFKQISGNRAKGIDSVSKQEYGVNLQSNLAMLIQRMKKMSYRPLPVKRVEIPKGNGKIRPLGISIFEDKIVQKMTHRILEAIYEPLFKDCSYGFRSKRGCHDAIKDLYQFLCDAPIQTVIDVDLEAFFDMIDHKLLEETLRMKIKDEGFMRYIIRMFKAGVLTKGEFSVSEEGVPQGSICSPILANIFAHYVIDEWFEDVVKKHCQGKVQLFRYADDMIICCEIGSDALKIKTVLPKRLAKYKLKMNEEKTKLVRFSKEDHQKGIRQEVFDFLGFTFFIGKSRKGSSTPKLKTRKKTFSAKLKRAKEWLMETRGTLCTQSTWKTLCAKLRGHIQYFGVSFNSKHISTFLNKIRAMIFKALNRRSQRRSMTWEQFNLFLKRYPLPQVKIMVKLF